MAQKLQIKTPQTKDGVTLLYDEDKQPVYKISFAQVAAKKNLESINAKLPVHLRHELTVVEVDAEIKGASNKELKKKLELLEGQKENKSLLERIALLESELEERKNTEKSGAPTPPAQLGTVVEMLEKIKGLSLKQDIENLVKDDDRKDVKDAAAKRIAELEAATK